MFRQLLLISGSKLIVLAIRKIIIYETVLSVHFTATVITVAMNSVHIFYQGHTSSVILLRANNGQ